MNTVLPKVDNTWQSIFKNLFEQPYMQALNKFISKEIQEKKTIYPPRDKIFSAFNFTPLEQIKVVILGQDPYHGEGQAHGLAFSVPEECKTPPSLVNIYKELANDLGSENFTIPSHGNLSKWAKQGVLLLNTVLTVRAHEAHSHQGQGWEQFTDEIIKLVNNSDDKVIFVLWGNPAKTKIKLIDTSKHIILTAAHPSPLSAYRGFFGCKHFSQINAQLMAMGKEPIDWQV